MFYADTFKWNYFSTGTYAVGIICWYHCTYLFDTLLLIEGIETERYQGHRLVHHGRRKGTLPLSYLLDQRYLMYMYCTAGLRIRSIFGPIRLRILQIRILKPDPGSCWHLKNQFKHQNFFHMKHISSDIWMIIIFIWKNGKIRLKMFKPLFFKYFFFVYTTLHCQSTDRIRIRWKFSGSGSGSGSYQKGPDPDPQPCCTVDQR